MSGQTTGTPDSKDAKKGEKSPYRKTLNLPRTSFPMKANLVQNEAGSIKRWDKAGVYRALLERESPKGTYVFHDGPPYANGSIHLGHVMNKCLKDFVVRSRWMAGYRVPFVPGWDCHGLPIEHKVMTELVESGKAQKLAELPDGARQMAVRRECAKHVGKAQKLQAGQMQRMLTLGDYADPYLTLKPEYEGAVMEVLADLVKQGLVFRALKPVHWSVDNETALADAELEYEDREDVSVFVDFEAEDAGAVYAAFGLTDADRDEKGLSATPSFMIWTTTPWTLPANMAIAVNERFEYALVRVDGNLTILAAPMAEDVLKKVGAESSDVVATCPGSALIGLRYRSPLRDDKPTGADGETSDAVWTVVGADYVTLEDGTGLVHTATGHGAEDYQTGLRVGLPVYCPVLGDGTYDATVPEWLRGLSVWDANAKVVEHLRASGHLFHDNKFMHSYPHDWRSKGPVIFRCTEQWFVGVDRPTKHGPSLKQMALDAVAPENNSGVGFIPEWGRNRMRGMLESRPDWCISRQRSWGLPIPAFTTPTGETLMTEASVMAISASFRERGSDAWFTETPEQLLAGYDPGADPDAPEGVDVASLQKGGDILDVWFESGSSWHAVMRQRSGGQDYPVEVYLEGSDQHRGWFQLSLLPALGVTGRPPYRRLLTHGFMVNKDGRKLSKSSGDTIEELFKDFGADVLRWWVCSLSYENDVKVDREFFSLAGESYRKVRNTLRFVLSNLDGYRHDGADWTPDPTSPEAWVLAELDQLAETVERAYEEFDFQGVHKALYNFCNDTLSAEYLGLIKDRMYCDGADSARRLSSQQALYTIADTLCRLLAPVLCHTADEAYRTLTGDEQACVHTLTFAPRTGASPDPAWHAALRAREFAAEHMEQAKVAGVENPLDMGVALPDPDTLLAHLDPVDLADLLGVSRVQLDGNLEQARIDDLRAEPRCERSWKRDGTVRERSDGGMLSDRDAAALGLDA